MVIDIASQLNPSQLSFCWRLCWCSATPLTQANQLGGRERGPSGYSAAANVTAHPDDCTPLAGCASVDSQVHAGAHAQCAERTAGAVDRTNLTG
jgi:hypothetical protein